MNRYYDIVVVGAGPAGLVLASLLKDQGLSIALIDKNSRQELANPPFDGREIALTHFTHHILEKTDILAHISPQHVYPLKEAKVINGTSDYALHFPQPTYARGKACDQLGFLIPNCDIRKAAYENVSQLNNVHLYADCSVSEVETDNQSVSVDLANGETITASLLVCADGRFSKIRSSLGIPIDTHQFGRSVICFRAHHQKSNEHTARECFFYGRTLAILPLEEHLSSMVITIDSPKATDLMNLSKEAMNQELLILTKGLLGKIEVEDKRFTYPLVGVHARRFFAHRAALIGDAAVGMHPVTAHGFNLGAESAAQLSYLILEAKKKDADIGNETLLERYNLRQQLITRPLYHGTNFVVGLFVDESPAARLLRKAVIHMGNHLSPLKYLISKRLTG
jgi:ubiquinone biosynthesis hydroxylase, ubiH/ubiF/visC/COQ6 family